MDNENKITPAEESTPVAAGTPESESARMTIIDARFGLALDFTEKPTAEEFCQIVATMFQNMAMGTMRPEVINQALADGEANKIFRFAIEGKTAPDGVIDVTISLIKPESSIIKPPPGTLSFLSRKDRRAVERKSKK